MAQKYAVMDIGTNSIRLMIAQVRQDTEIVVREKRLITTRLGEGLQQNHLLSEEAMLRTLDALEKFMAVCRASEFKEIYAFATNAVRSAHNGDDFSERFRERFDVRLDVISGEDEGKIAYLGVIGNQGIGRVIDIGGGSTELIAGVDTQPQVVGSIEMGCVKAAQLLPDNAEGYIQVRELVRNSPALVGELKKRTGNMLYTERNGKALLSKIQKQLGSVYAVGGTATTLAALAAGLQSVYDPRIVHGRMLTHGEIRRVLSEIGPLTVQQRAKIPILRERADLICFGANILLLCMDELKVSTVITSDRDNLEGYLQLQLNKMNGIV